VTAVRRTLPAALTLWALAALGAAQHAPAEALSGSALSPDLATLAQPSVRTLPDRAQAELLDVPPSGPGSLVREGGRVIVNVGFEAGALARLEALREAGAGVVAASRRYQTVTVSVPPADLQALARVPGVGSVTASPAPVVHAAGGCEGGSVVSEGVEQLRVPAARGAFGLRGAGITVGVLSDSFDTATEEAFGAGPIATHAEEDTKSNDLTGPLATCSGQQTAVEVIDEAPESLAGQVNDEGRAMTQIVHDVAPHARLAFATAFRSEISFAQNIERLAKPVSEGGAGAKVIVDDVSYFEEPFFQDGPVANAIAKVSAEGVTYLTAAGNDNLFDSSNPEIASWEAPQFRDASSCPQAVQEELTGKGFTPQCMDFDPSAGEDNAFGFTVKPESELIVDLQWAEPWNGVHADLDAYLLAAGQIVEKKKEDNPSVIKKPVEWFRWRNTKATAQEVSLAINRCTGSCNEKAEPSAEPRLKFILMGGVSKTEHPLSSGGDVVGPTIYGHAASTDAITLGAVNYSGNTKVETYSSRGPAKHFFEPVSGTKTPAASIPEEVIPKPDVVATDCGATTFFAQFTAGAWRFCGTSAAAPHAAGVAALMVQGAGAGPAQIAAGLESSARPIVGFGPAAVGAGLIDAEGALEAVAATPTTSDEPSTTVPPIEAEVEYEPEAEPEREPEKEPEEHPEEEPKREQPVPVNPTPVPTPSAVSTTPEPTPPALAPATRIAKHPRKLVRTRRARARVVFRFAANPTGASFRCQFDGSSWRACAPRVWRWFGLGRHVVRVQARGADGLADPTPAVFRFRVARSR
jgi:subtilisin family serine protease